MTLTASRGDAGQATRREAAATDPAALQQRLNALELELQNAKRAHEEARRSKAEFISNISHELRTPLQTIIGFSELGASMAHNRAGSPGNTGSIGSIGHSDFEDMFNDICAGGQRMLRLVNALLDVASLSSSVGSLNLQRVDLIELIDSVVNANANANTNRDSTQTKTQGRALDLSLSFVRPPQPVWAWVEPARMQQVLRNVLTNAQRFAGNTGTHISCVDHAAGSISISIRDHGAGIPGDELEAVFDPFFQSSRTRDGSGGVGLGLTVCRKIMGAHGGSIHAENAPDGGCVIRIHLPYHPHDPQQPHDPQVQNSAPSGVQR